MVAIDLGSLCTIHSSSNSITGKWISSSDSVSVEFSVREGTLCHNVKGSSLSKIVGLGNIKGSLDRASSRENLEGRFRKVGAEDNMHALESKRLASLGDVGFLQVVVIWAVLVSGGDYFGGQRGTELTIKESAQAH